MAYRGTLLSLLLVALAAGVVIDGVSGDSSFMRRRLAGLEGPSTGVAGAPSTNCLIPCLSPLSCCKLPNTGILPGLCINTGTDPLNCGICGNVCPLGSTCCKGKCANLLNDPNNCGGCGDKFKCPSKDVCKFGMCKYAA